jgi:hypothetical protein
MEIIDAGDWNKRMTELWAIRIKHDQSHVWPIVFWRVSSHHLFTMPEDVASLGFRQHLIIPATCVDHHDNTLSAEPQ